MTGNRGGPMTVARNRSDRSHARGERQRSKDGRPGLCGDLTPSPTPAGLRRWPRPVGRAALRAQSVAARPHERTGRRQSPRRNTPRASASVRREMLTGWALLCTFSYMKETVGLGSVLPDDLPTAFSYTDARDGGWSDRQLRAWRDLGAIELLSRGLYLRQDAPLTDTDLLQIAARAPLATLCLSSALARDELIDDIPNEIDVALPRGQRAPSTTGPIRWHHFDADTFKIGREVFTLVDGFELGIYSPERCIIDAFRLRHREGTELAYQALKAWLRRPGSQPAQLMTMAETFPRTKAGLRDALDLLL